MIQPCRQLDQKKKKTLTRLTKTQIGSQLCLKNDSDIRRLKIHQQWTCSHWSCPICRSSTVKGQIWVFLRHTPAHITHLSTELARHSIRVHQNEERRDKIFPQSFTAEKRIRSHHDKGFWNMQRSVLTLLLARPEPDDFLNLTSLDWGRVRVRDEVLLRHRANVQHISSMASSDYQKNDARTQPRKKKTPAVVITQRRQPKWSSKAEATRNHHVHMQY